MKNVPATASPATITIGGLRIQVAARGLPAAFQTDLLAAYADFLDGGAPGPLPLPDLAIEIAVEDGPPFRRPEAGETSWRITTRQEGARLIYQSYCEQGWLDIPAQAGRLLLRPGGRIENFLRLATARLALARGGLLLHASGVIIDGCGYAFFGRSGAGKSTVAALAPAASVVLSDDLVLLCSTGGRLTLHGVPFYGEARDAPRANAAAPLGGLYALEQAHHHLVTPLPPAVAAARLLAATPFVADDPEAMLCAFEICTSLAKTAPVRQLSFARNGGFWPLLKDM
jgi:hypothetical protein